MAQRDNKDDLKMAKISADIAAVTKDDSFAMRTIVVMNVVFSLERFLQQVLASNTSPSNADMI